MIFHRAEQSLFQEIPYPSHNKNHIHTPLGVQNSGSLSVGPNWRMVETPLTRFQASNFHRTQVRLHRKTGLPGIATVLFLKQCVSYFNVFCIPVETGDFVRRHDKGAAI